MGEGLSEIPESAENWKRSVEGGAEDEPVAELEEGKSALLDGNLVQVASLQGEYAWIHPITEPENQTRIYKERLTPLKQVAEIPKFLR